MSREKAAPQHFSSVPTQVGVIFKTFRVNAQPIEGASLNGAVGVIMPSQQHARDIDKGFVYIFTKIWDGGMPRVNHEEHHIVSKGQAVSIPPPSNRRRNVYYAYSRIQLTEERLADIMRDIRDTSSPRRVVQVNSEVFFQRQAPQHNRDNMPEHRGLARHFDSRRGIIYLFDWYGYLEECANTYHMLVSANFNSYRRFLDTNVDLRGVIKPGSNLERGELYALADSIDTLILENRSRRGALRNNAADLYRFYDRTTDGINNTRSGWQAALLNNTIHLISLLLANRQANSTFIDYVYEPQKRDELLGLISKCLFRYQEILHKQEKARLFRVWEHIHIDIERTNNLLEHLMNTNGEATAHDVHKHIGDASIYLYIAAIVKAPAGTELPPELDSIIAIWLLADIGTVGRLAANNLLANGGLIEYSEVQDAVTFTRINGRMLFNTAKHVKTAIEIIDERKTIQMRMLSAAKVAGGHFGTVVGFHTVLTELALAAQSHNFESALPHFITATSPVFAKIAERSGNLVAGAGKFGAGLFAGSAVSLARVVVNMVRAGNMGDINTLGLFAISGVFFTGSGVTLKIATAVLAPKLKIALALAFFLAARFTEQAARRRLEDRVTLVLRNSIWGRDLTLRTNDSRIGWWWPLRRDRDSIDSGDAEILFSSRQLSDLNRRDLMQLNLIGRDNDNPTRETFERNNHMLNLLPQIPPLTLTVAQSDTVLSNFHIAHHEVRISGLPDFPLIKAVTITLTRVLPEEVLFNETFSYGGNNDLLPLLVRRNNANVTDVFDSVHAEHLVIVFVPDNILLNNTVRQVISSPRYVALPSNHHPVAIQKRLEITISYTSETLLPLRIEHEFSSHSQVAAW